MNRLKNEGLAIRNLTAPGVVSGEVTGPKDREMTPMKTQVSLCTPFGRALAVYVGLGADGKHYVDFAPAVAVAHRHETADYFDTRHSYFLFHRDGCGVGDQLELLQSDDEVYDTLNAPWPSCDDEVETSHVVFELKRRLATLLAARARDKAAHARPTATPPPTEPRP